MLETFFWAFADCLYSENFGHRVVYLTTFPVFALFTLGVDFAKNFATIAICRFIAAVFGSPAIAIGGGTVADLFAPSHMGLTFPLICVSPFVGPALGKIK